MTIASLHNNTTGPVKLDEPFLGPQRKLDTDGAVMKFEYMKWAD